MTHVITDACVGRKDASCVAVCPVDCIHPTPDEDGFAEAKQLYVDPESCIDCGACVLECPVEAIVLEADLPEALRTATHENAAWYRGA